MGGASECGSVGESSRDGRHRQGVRISDVELWMGTKHSVRQKVTKLGLGPSVHDAMNDEMQVGAWVDVVRDARGDDRQDMAGALAALVEPGKEPIATAQDQTSKLALSAIV